jgi:hypothetical protein
MFRVVPPNDGWMYHPKHVEQSPDINKLCKVCFLLDMYWNILELYLYSLTGYSMPVQGRSFCVSLTLSFCQALPLCSFRTFIFQHRPQITSEFQFCLPESERRYGTTCGDAFVA